MSLDFHQTSTALCLSKLSITETYQNVRILFKGILNSYKDYFDKVLDVMENSDNQTNSFDGTYSEVYNLQQIRKANLD